MMSKYDRWMKVTDQYFATVTKERLISDSRRVGIILVNRPSGVLGAVHPKPIVAREVIEDVKAKARLSGYTLNDAIRDSLGVVSRPRPARRATLGTRRDTKPKARKPQSSR